MKASHRHALKDNEFGHLLADAQSSLSQHRRLLLGILAVVLVGGGGFGGYRAWQANLENKAGALLAAGVVIEESSIQAPEPPAGTTLDANSPGGQPPGTYPSLATRLEAQLPKFMEAADAYPATVAGQSARLHAADTLVQLGRTDEAIRQFDLLSTSKNPLMVNAAKLGKAAAQLRAGQYDAAIAVFKAESELATSTWPAEAMLFELARAYTLAGKTEDARKTLQQIIDKHGSTPFGAEARTELARLSS